MFKTRVTEMLGIEYPIIGGTMQWLSRAELVAAISNAGCLGIIPSATFSSKDELKREIRKTRELTDKPFAVNVNLFPMMRPFSVEDMIDAIHEEGVGIIETSGRSPEGYVERIKKPGVIYMHKCARVRDAIKAERLGADIVTVVGTECGGHPSAEGVTSMVMVPRTVDAVKIPVLAGGGIADGRGLVAALALGAEGVVIGTRLMATTECPFHDRFKEIIVAADVTDTALLLMSHGAPLRAYRNAQAGKVIELESRGAELAEVLPLMSGILGRTAYETGDVDGAILAMGQCAGLVKEVKTVKQVVDGIVEQARQISKRIAAPI